MASSALLSGAAVLFAVAAALFSTSARFSHAASVDANVVMTLTACTSQNTSSGALVAMNPYTGAWKVLSVFDFPEPLADHCLLEDLPTPTLDPATNTLYLYFLDERVQTTIDIATGQLTGWSQPSVPFAEFQGFGSMFYSPNASSLFGLSSFVSNESGCPNGCYQYGSYQVVTGDYEQIALLPFRTVMDKAILVDGSHLFVQGSNDLRPQSESCARPGHPEDICLLTVDSNTGDLVASVLTNFTAYKLRMGTESRDSLVAFVEDYSTEIKALCGHEGKNFLFGSVQISNGTLEPLGCVSKNDTIETNENVSGFSADGTLWATGSGDWGDGYGASVWVFDATTGHTVLYTKLLGLLEELGADAYQIVSVDFIG